MLKLIRFLVPYLRENWGRTLISLLLSIPLAGIKVYQASLVKPIFDKGLSGSATTEQALKLAGLLLLLGLLNYPCRFFHFYLIRYVVDKATNQLRLKVYDKFNRMNLSFFHDSKMGGLLSNLLNDTTLLAYGFRGMVDLIREPVTAILLLGLALYRDWQLTMVVLIVAPLFIIIFQKSGRKVRSSMADVQKHMAEMTHNASEGITGQKIFKAFNLQNYVFERFSRFQDLFFDAQMRTTFEEENAHPLVELVGALAFCGVIVFAHHRISIGAISQGDFISFVTALALLMDPIRKYSQANVKINQSRAALSRIEHLLSLEEEVDKGEIVDHKFQNKIEVRNLSFSYGDVEVIKNLSFEIKKGEKVAVVGPSGSGKSTLVNLLLRLYPISKGEILIDDVPIENYSLKTLRSMFGLVGQDIFLFNDTLLENLKVGKDYPTHKIDEALTVSGSKAFVSALPDGVNTVIGDRGVKLSGGQSQRLTVARAFLIDTPILLFDEATSALDNESEKEVQEAMDRLAKDKTILAVAHRLSTIKNYDKIIFLYHGKKIEEGTHVELMGKSGEYKRLYELGQRS